MSDEEEGENLYDELVEEDDEPLDDDDDVDGSGGSAAASRAARDELVDFLDEEDDCEDFIDCGLLAECRADGRKRKTARRQGAQDQWDIIIEDVNESQCQASIAATALVELDSAESCGLHKRGSIYD